MWLKSKLFFPFIVINRRRLILTAQFLLIRFWFFSYLKLSSKCTRLPKKGFDKFYFFSCWRCDEIHKGTQTKKFGVIFYQVVKKKLLHFHNINSLSNVIDYIFYSFFVPFPGKKKIKNISHDVVSWHFCSVSFPLSPISMCWQRRRRPRRHTFCVFVEILFACIFLHRIINIGIIIN